MSVRALIRVLAIDFPPERTGTKFVLAILAWRYDEDEGHAWQTVAELAAMASVSERQLHRDLAWLVDQTLLKIEQRRRANGTQTSSSYTFPWLKEDADQQTDAHVSPSTPSPADAHDTRPTDAHDTLSQGSRLTRTSPLSIRPFSRQPPSRQPSPSSFASLTDDGAPDHELPVPAAAPDGAPPAAVTGQLIDLADRLATTPRALADAEALKREAQAKAAAWTAAYEARQAARALQACAATGTDGAAVPVPEHPGTPGPGEPG